MNRDFDIGAESPFRPQFVDDALPGSPAGSWMVSNNDVSSSARTACCDCAGNSVSSPRTLCGGKGLPGTQHDAHQHERTGLQDRVGRGLAQRGAQRRDVDGLAGLAWSSATDASA